MSLDGMERFDGRRRNKVHGLDRIKDEPKKDASAFLVVVLCMCLAAVFVVGIVGIILSAHASPSERAVYTSLYNDGAPDTTGVIIAVPSGGVMADTSAYGGTAERYRPGEYFWRPDQVSSNLVDIYRDGSLVMPGIMFGAGSIADSALSYRQLATFVAIDSADVNLLRYPLRQTGSVPNQGKLQTDTLVVTNSFSIPDTVEILEVPSFDSPVFANGAFYCVSSGRDTLIFDSTPTQAITVPGAAIDDIVIVSITHTVYRNSLDDTDDWDWWKNSDWLTVSGKVTAANTVTVQAFHVYGGNLNQTFYPTSKIKSGHYLRVHYAWWLLRKAL